MTFSSPYLELLKNRINLRTIPFSERGSRLMVFRDNAPGNAFCAQIASSRRRDDIHLHTVVVLDRDSL